MKNPSYQSSYKFKCRKPTRKILHYQVDLPGSYSAAPLVDDHYIFRSMPLRTVLTERGDGSPPEGLSEGSTEVGKTIRICESRHPRAADDGVELFLTLSLLLWIGDHGKHEPVQRTRRLQLFSKGS